MKNLETKRFQAKVASILIDQKNKITKDTCKYIEVFTSIEMVKFSNEMPYTGDFKNKIFFTYSDHYQGNSATYMSIGNLNQPHTSMDDRGYIRGVATDLEGYLTLRSAKMLNHNLDCVAPIYLPKFRKSKNSESYKAICKEIIQNGCLELDLFILEQQRLLNEKLREMTDCSLLHYLRNI